MVLKSMEEKLAELEFSSRIKTTSKKTAKITWDTQKSPGNLRKIVVTNISEEAPIKISVKNLNKMVMMMMMMMIIVHVFIIKFLRKFEAELQYFSFEFRILRSKIENTRR